MVVLHGIVKLIAVMTVPFIMEVPIVINIHNVFSNNLLNLGNIYSRCGIAQLLACLTGYCDCFGTARLAGSLQ